MFVTFKGMEFCLQNTSQALSRYKAFSPCVFWSHGCYIPAQLTIACWHLGMGEVNKPDLRKAILPDMPCLEVLMCNYASVHTLSVPRQCELWGNVNYGDMHHGQVMSWTELCWRQTMNLMQRSMGRIQIRVRVNLLFALHVQALAIAPKPLCGQEFSGFPCIKVLLSQGGLACSRAAVCRRPKIIFSWHEYHKAFSVYCYETGAASTLASCQRRVFESYFASPR